MPRYKLSNVPAATLQAELERRAKKLSVLLKLRDDVDRQIAELKALASQFRTVTKRGRKAKAAAVRSFALGHMATVAGLSNPHRTAKGARCLAVDMGTFSV